MLQKKRLTDFVLVFYCVIFYSLWIVMELLISPIMENALNEWASAYVSTTIKLIVWTIPALCLIKYFENDMWLSLKEMVTSKVKWLQYGSIAAGVLLCYSVISYFISGGISKDFKAIDLIGVVIFVGITEEAVFRGWLLNALLKIRNLRSAVIINAVLFVLIHFPIWISQGVFADPLTVFINCVSIFVLSTFFAYSFIKTKNIFVPVIFHMLWNLFAIIW